MSVGTLCIWLSVILFLIAFFVPVFYKGPSRWRLEIAGLFFLALAFALGASGGLHA